MTVNNAPARFCLCGHRLSVADTDGQCLSCRYPIRVTRARAGEFCKCGRRKSTPKMGYCLECSAAYNRRRRAALRAAKGAAGHGKTA